MRVRIVVDSATTQAVRDIAAALSQNRESLPSHVDWRPRMNCEGPDHWGLETDPLPLDVALDVLRAAKDHV